VGLVYVSVWSSSLKLSSAYQMIAIKVFVAREEKGASFKVGAIEIPLLHKEWEHTLSGE